MPRSSKTILVVEDGQAVRELVCQMLVQNGYRVLEARDGPEALQIAEHHRNSVDLVLTDIMMPDMLGTELAHRLADISPDVPIVFMSGYTEDPAVRRLCRQPIAFLSKPFTSISLVEKIREALDRAAARD